MIFLSGASLPWYLIGVLVTALLAVFYAVIRGKLVPDSVAKMLRESSEKRAEELVKANEANVQSIATLAGSVEKLVVYAENADKVLKALSAQAGRPHSRPRGGDPT